MSQTETFNGNSYQVVAWANREQLIYFAQFGDYQGEWIMVSKGADSQYRVYKDYYGSCSGCDAYEATEPRTRQDAEKFAKDYPPFIIVPQQTMKNLVEAGTLMKIMPANIRSSHSEINYPDAVSDIQVVVKIEEGLPLTVADVLEAKNQEIKQRALKALGYEKFVEEVKPEVLDVDGENQLLKVDDIVFAYVKDSSTPRRYLLRVPPQMKTVKSAIAWTFNMPESEYKPIVET